MPKMTKAHALKGTSPGLIQSAGHMQVIPLIGEDVAPQIGSPNQLMFSMAGDYGNMRFENMGHTPAILPSHIGYIVPGQGQNHAMTSAAIVGRGEKNFNNALCTEASQGGGIRKDKHDFLILPFQLRNSALKLRTGTGYNRLWNEIGRFNERMGIKGDTGHLDRFFTQFKDTLEIFIAQFELVPDQVGAIVLLDGSVIGVERAPSQAYFRDVWKALIRDCYGSVAIEFTRGLGPNPHRLGSVAKLKGDLDTPEGILKAIQDAQRKDQGFAEAVFKDVAEFKSINYKPDWTWVDDLQVATIEPTGWAGQIVHNRDDESVYASVLSTTGLR